MREGLTGLWGQASPSAAARLQPTAELQPQPLTQAASGPAATSWHRVGAGVGSPTANSCSCSCRCCGQQGSETNSAAQHRWHAGTYVATQRPVQAWVQLLLCIALLAPLHSLFT